MISFEEYFKIIGLLLEIFGRILNSKSVLSKISSYFTNTFGLFWLGSKCHKQDFVVRTALDAGG